MSVAQRAVGIGELPSIGTAVVTMGVFDGVHLGHRAILAATRDLRRRAGDAAASRSSSTRRRKRCCGRELVSRGSRHSP